MGKLPEPWKCSKGHTVAAWVVTCPDCRHLTSPNDEEVLPQVPVETVSVTARVKVVDWTPPAPPGPTRNARWRATHKADYNAYMRDYMRRRRV